ncbi:MAG TPA: alpha/beta fold hydrolase [Kofleriaceae bacterium]|nr:alpha/beta fold hydrolase [Kofleriaceae bacterium]
MRLGRALRAGAIGLAGLIVLVAAAGAAMFRRDLPVEDLIARYGAGPTSQFMDLQGMRIHYRDEGSGPPLLLVHGTFSSLDTWDGWARELAGHRRVVRLDLPGFGLTGPAPDRDYRVERYARVVGEFLDRLDLARADLAGNSLGGRVAITFALAHPERVRKLILIDAAGLSGATPPPIIQLARMPILNRALRHLTPRFLVRRNLEEVYGDASKVTDDLVDRYQAMQRRAGNREALLDRLNGPLDPDLDDRIAELHVPVLIQWGSEDRWIPISAAHRFEREIAGAELHVYDGAGHVPMEELPQATARDADAFLGRD